MNDAAARVLDLLTYIEQVEKLKTKPPFSVSSEFFAAHANELSGLAELELNANAEDDFWLRVPRLQEIAPPDAGDILRPWLTESKSPDKEPLLKAESIQYDGNREIGRQQLVDNPDITALYHWYLECQWQPWAGAERPRRKTISRYRQLFALQQQLALDGTETPVELVWGIGFGTWKKEGYGTAVGHPLFTQACELHLDERSFAIEVRPRDVASKLEVDCYAEMEVGGVRQLEAYWTSMLETDASRISPFDPSTFEPLLRAAVGYLDPAGSYIPLREAPSQPGPQLRVTANWVLFARKRSVDIFLEDIRRLKARVTAAEQMPAVIEGFVTTGDDTVRAQPEVPFRGLSSSDGREGAMELYFPMPYNDEQVSIVQKLEANDGVVVQGPPGTGKTHTIANVVSHFLAKGKRVLVTAKGESALAVLQEKLPERIRPLSVSLLSDERDGMKQFEHSIQAIATNVSAMNPAQSQASITALEGKLSQLHAKISRVDQKVAEYAAKHMMTYPFHGRDVTAEELAIQVVDQAQAHAWFDDVLPPKLDQIPPFIDADVQAVRQARLDVGDDLARAYDIPPVPEQIPAWKHLQAVHRDLTKVRKIDSSITVGSIFTVQNLGPDTLLEVQSAIAFFQERFDLKAALIASRFAWVSTLLVRFAAMQVGDPMWGVLGLLSSDITMLESARKARIAKAVQVPDGVEANEEFEDAVLRLSAGKSAFALPFGKAEARKLIGTVTILGAKPGSADDWSVVRDVVMWRRDVRKCAARLNALAVEFGFDEVNLAERPDTLIRAMVEIEAEIRQVQKMATQYEADLRGRVQKIFGATIAARAVAEGETVVDTVRESLRVYEERILLEHADANRQVMLDGLASCTGASAEGMRSLINSLDHANSEEAVLQTAWAALSEEAARLHRLHMPLGVIRRFVRLLDDAGVVRWAERVRSIPAKGVFDSVLPSTWYEAWKWHQASALLEQIDAHHTLRDLFEERRLLTTTLASTYQDIVAEKTWLGVHNNSPESVRQALQAYLNAVQAMGAGTGVRAIRHRRAARQAMERAYKAVPCWVLPQWRISEALPAELGLFDLVIIDEASQSDIWALPALLRGKKLLVVGDHKQVSPSAVGMAEEKIKNLMARFLGTQPHGDQMTPDKSIYDLARVVFAGNSVMLKEHFRCVPAIIEYSNREFYEGDIKPLRIPKANERLDPPLIDVYVKGGFRSGDVNEPEAQAIVGEIEAILKDETLARKSIGVVTLLGNTQAHRINELVNSRISPVDIRARQIAVGAPPNFQGRERDIMLISMVLAPGDRAVPKKLDFEQRFNVALSRARDRMYLFRSVLEGQFKEETLNARLMRHFRQPFSQDITKVGELREKCESGFEREMFDALVGRGYRVQPQVPCGGYRIDFVVEGNEGRRLAVECDGDAFHGPAQWESDMARQRVLERAGWTFWRCFASSFVRNREEVFGDLLKTLHGLGIEPVGAESIDSTIWVHAKQVDPLGIDTPAIKEAATEGTATDLSDVPVNTQEEPAQ